LRQLVHPSPAAVKLYADLPLTPSKLGGKRSRDNQSMNLDDTSSLDVAESAESKASAVAPTSVRKRQRIHNPNSGDNVDDVPLFHEVTEVLDVKQRNDHDDDDEEEVVNLRMPYIPPTGHQRIPIGQPGKNLKSISLNEKV
jgi:hypothetical protein